MGAEGAVSGAAGSAAVSSAGAAGAADAAGSSFTLWLGADSSALRLRGCRVIFRSFRIIFLRLLFGAVGRIGLTLPQQSRRLHRQTRRLGRQQGCGAKTAHRDGKSHHRRGHHLARRTARLLFWCSCIFLSHSACSASKLYSNAASRRRKCFFTFIVYTQSQSPVNVLRCLMRGVSWKFSTTADVPCGKRTRPPYYCIQKKKR